MRRGIRGVPAFLIGDEVVVGFDPDRIEQLIDFVIVDCPDCDASLRLPKGKGKLAVTCPKCKTEFKTTT